MSIPGRATVLASSIFFDIASVLLIFDFLTFHKYITATTKTNDTLGIGQGIGWFLGFVLLIDWIVFDTFPVYGPSRRALVGATLKLIASVFFCIQPFSEYAHYRDFGVPWANFVGIIFFHTGNVIDAIGMAGLFNCKVVLSAANLPVCGMQVYMVATWVLVVAGVLQYAAIPPPNGPGAKLSAQATDFIPPAQVAGAVLLLIGSLIYTGWAAFVGRERRARADPLLDITPVPGF